MNSNQSETKFSIRINPRSEWFGLILIENSVWINPSSDWFGLVRIHSDCCLELIRIRPDRFFTVFHQTSYKTFFGMIRIGSDTDIGMNRNEFLSNTFARDYEIHSTVISKYYRWLSIFLHVCRLKLLNGFCYVCAFCGFTLAPGSMLSILCRSQRTQLEASHC